MGSCQLNELGKFAVIIHLIKMFHWSKLRYNIYTFHIRDGPVPAHSLLNVQAVGISRLQIG